MTVGRPTWGSCDAVQRSQLRTIGPVTIASPNFRIPQTIRFERNSLPVGRKVWPRTSTLSSDDEPQAGLEDAFSSSQVQTPDVVLKRAAAGKRADYLWEKWKENSALTPTPGIGRGVPPETGYAPQTGETPTRWKRTRYHVRPESKWEAHISTRCRMSAAWVRHPRRARHRGPPPHPQQCLGRKPRLNHRERKRDRNRDSDLAAT